MNYYTFVPGQIVKPNDWVMGERFKLTQNGPLASGRMESFGPGSIIPHDIIVNYPWAKDYKKSGYNVSPLNTSIKWL
jgi:hypothetical protein